MRTLARRLLVGAVMVTAGLALGACGSDSGDSGSTPALSSSAATTAAATAAPEDTIAPDAAVATGLVKLKGVGATVAAASDGDSAKTAAEGLEPVWQPIEGTVKKNEPDLYLDIEDSFQRMESGDLANAKKGAAAMQTAVDDYLAKHHG